MNREQAKELLPIIQAFAEDKIIQSKRINGMWLDLEMKDALNITRVIEEPQKYRIKPEPKYRPFANAEECWQEMQKHQPFGWIRNKKTKEYELLQRVAPKNGVIDQYACAFKRWIFADGTPFGIKEE